MRLIPRMLRGYWWRQRWARFKTRKLRKLPWAEWSAAGYFRGEPEYYKGGFATSHEYLRALEVIQDSLPLESRGSDAGGRE